MNTNAAYYANTLHGPLSQATVVMALCLLHIGGRLWHVLQKLPVEGVVPKVRVANQAVNFPDGFQKTSSR